MKFFGGKDKIIYPELSFKICGLCYETHNKLGRYLNEKQYADYLEELFKNNGIKYEREKPLLPLFNGERLARNIPDFVIEDVIILDLKAKFMVTKQDYFQMQRYLNSANKKLGLIVNFRRKFLHPKRVLNMNFRQSNSASVANPTKDTGIISKLRRYMNHS
ncbi:GxxExxY protein [Candidatus Falkowbacteria bacterium]|nr:GxxExxY protein [Candidatus Falkowbacteria bacterium]